jgi:hypothetical protein
LPHAMLGDNTKTGNKYENTFSSRRKESHANITINKQNTIKIYDADIVLPINCDISLRCFLQNVNRFLKTKAAIVLTLYCFPLGFEITF